MSKFSETMRWMAKDVRTKDGEKGVIANPCTFITARGLRKDMLGDLGFTPTGFYPSFESKLSNQLLTYTNYTSERFGPTEEEFDD